MPRTVRDAKLTSRNARADIKNGLYWKVIDPGLYIGYRKSKNGGRWLARWYLRGLAPRKAQKDGQLYKHAGGKAYHHVTLPGITDDRQEADGALALSFAQAQKKIRELYAAALLPSRAAGPLTVKEACERYVAYLRAERKTAEDARRRLENHVYPDIAARKRDIVAQRAEIERKKKLHVNAARKGSARASDRLARLAAHEEALARAEAKLPVLSLGDRAVAALTKEEVEEVKRAMVKRSPTDPEVERRSKLSANRVLTSLKAALSRAFADSSNAIPSDAAWRLVKPYRRVVRAREVFLDVAQSQRLINVTSGAFRNLVTAALLTGARPPHELANARVKDFSASHGTLTVDGKTGRRDIVLTREAVQFFKSISAGRVPDALLLPKDDGSAWIKGQHTRPMREAAKKAKLPRGTTLYSLRHTFASQALLNGMHLKLLSEIMGTSVSMLEAHYAKFTHGSRQRLVEEFAPHLGLRRGNVVVLPRP